MIKYKLEIIMFFWINVHLIGIIMSSIDSLTQFKQNASYGMKN
jgi:hypothetical protein